MIAWNLLRLWIKYIDLLMPLVLREHFFPSFEHFHDAKQIKSFHLWITVKMKKIIYFQKGRS